jgi:WD repeat-containing protein 42A
MQGDKQIVNCLEPHPYATILATSGIEKDIKVWSPTTPDLIPLSDDVKELMEANKRKKRSMHISLSRLM